MTTTESVRKVAQVLIVAGSDSGAGAGIQADLKVCAARGVYCAFVTTAVTAQNTRGVQSVHLLPPEFVSEQLKYVLSDFDFDVVFRNKLEFFAAANVSSSFPPPDIPEIAFPGRSNVGKSSLLNALTRQLGVVRTYDKPGLTQTINFFGLGPKVRLVDLPGYGFAFAKYEVKEAWEDLVKEYVSTRSSLKRVCLLVDTKWGMKPRDHELINLMERSNTKYQIVLTKTDVVFPMDVARQAMQIEEVLVIILYGCRKKIRPKKQVVNI